ncbi:hypothetical protein HKX48_000465 [Thoreauomyces humboldtii]|nr:hypothetical protein HKX48_000465 [Thoreauomyces humboldtii]
MSFIKNLFTSSSAASAAESEFPASIPFTEADCSTCEAHCETHPQIPAYLQKKIDPTLPLANSMKPYKRHILVTEGTSSRWPERLDSSSATLTNVIGECVEGRDRKDRTITTAADPMGEDVAEEGEVLLFPDMVAVKGVNAENASAFVEGWMGEDRKLGGEGGLETRKLEGKAWIFVCTHKKRDKRCGVAGPLLVDEFRKGIKEMGMESEVFVYGCSHFGGMVQTEMLSVHDAVPTADMYGVLRFFVLLGHKYAGNIIIYHQNPAVDGNWYGRVTACHVRPILETTVKEGKIFKQLWRGALAREDRVGTNGKREW